jgi:general stress protein YciG
MGAYTIYHIYGLKVGCTSNLPRRVTEYRSLGFQPSEIEVLEVIEDATDRQAGDIEWQWADHFGYPRGNHYAQVKYEARVLNGRKGGKAAAISVGPEALAERGRRMIRVRMERETPEQRSESARKGGFAATKATSVEFRQALGRKNGHRTKELGVGIHGMSQEQKIDAARKGALRVTELGLNPFLKMDRCPHCGFEGNIGNLKRWHLANCRKKGKS